MAPPPHFTSACRELTKVMLTFASTMAWRENLAEDLAYELIERTAMTVSVFSLSRLVIATAGINSTEHDFDTIPKEVLAALANNDYSDAIARAIEDMPRAAFETMLVYFVEKEKAHIKFNLPIIRHIHDNDIIPEHLLFAFMAASPRTTLEEHMYEKYEMLSSLHPFALFASLFGDDENEIDDGTNTDDHNNTKDQDSADCDTPDADTEDCGGRHAGDD